MPDWKEPNWKENDWKEFVRSRLADLALDPAENDEVQAELAAHLEESYEAFRAEGLSEQDATRRTQSQAADRRRRQRHSDPVEHDRRSDRGRTQHWLV